MYLLSNQIFSACKIGITSKAAKVSRVSQNEDQGWELIGLWNLSNGDDALLVEQSVRRWWRDIFGAPEAVTAEDMPQGGYTETASLFHVDLNETAARIDAEVKALSPS